MNELGKTKVGDLDKGWVILGQENVLQGTLITMAELEKEVVQLQVSDLDARHLVSGCTCGDVRSFDVVRKTLRTYG